MKTLKHIFSLLVISGLGYLAFKLYKLFKGFIELDKTLPQYLGNIIGDNPVVSIAAAFNKITITVKFSQDVIEKNKGLENIIRDYVTDFYPIFKADNVKVLIEELKEEEKPAQKEKK